MKSISAENFPILISKEEIAQRIAKEAKSLNTFYADRSEAVLIVMVMKGSFIFVADLVRHLTVPCTVETLIASSYGQNGTERGQLTLHGLERLQVTGKDVLLIDDIFDSGLSLNACAEALSQQAPRSLKTLVLLKKTPPKQQKAPDHFLFEIGDAFVVGYGLDYKELYRNLPDIHQYVE